MAFDIVDIIRRHHSEFAAGLAVTMQLCLVVWSVGLVLGIGLGLASARNERAITVLFKSISFFLSGMPILVMLFLAHYPLQSALGIVVDPFITASVVLTIVNTVTVADLVRETVLDFPNQYVLAGKACGLSDWEIMSKIQLPIISRQLIPMLLPVQIAVMHYTVLASLISVEEIFRVAQRVNAAEYKATEIYVAVGIFFLAISLPANAIAIWLKHRFTRNTSER